ncbi:hypothetical protein [Streptomyces qinzhouensis]|uniref:Lipoprotein n=1 Tax=Streptomyces qinzhouensis TaxID=2599401 RepID=A0A5B8JMC0_9ACTN|nr:hypothetical protein [Streptomyces qinzhouensis]QDY78673.1 hypothetical protein FQU76_21570 [Streptomyces qinzhouensis]
MRRTGTRRGAVAFFGAMGIVLLLGGCGIRPTQVPVDGGPAPSRMPCAVTAEGGPETRPQSVPVRIYLVCAAQLVAVDRTAELPVAKSSDNGLQVARALVAELQKEPSQMEREAGFQTFVRSPVTVSAPRDGDPEDTYRLSRQPEDLPPEALSQLVCTLAESRAAAAGGGVILGGPGGYPPRVYDCTATTKSHPKNPAPARTVARIGTASPDGASLSREDVSR